MCLSVSVSHSLCWFYTFYISTYIYIDWLRHVASSLLHRTSLEGLVLQCPASFLASLPVPVPLLQSSDVCSPALQCRTGNYQQSSLAAHCFVQPASQKSHADMAQQSRAHCTAMRHSHCFNHSCTMLLLSVTTPWPASLYQVLLQRCGLQTNAHAGHAVHVYMQGMQTFEV